MLCIYIYICVCIYVHIDIVVDTDSSFANVNLTALAVGGKDAGDLPSVIVGGNHMLYPLANVYIPMENRHV